MEPQEDAVCLDLASRAAVEDALGLDVGDIRAEGTDPTIALTCTYVAGAGQLLILTSPADFSAFQAELDLAEAYGQVPQALDGVGDQAFYAPANADAPEQVVLTKGVVLVRIWNQTTPTIGRADFAELADAVADAIRSEVPPAP